MTEIEKKIRIDVFGKNNDSLIKSKMEWLKTLNCPNLEIPNDRLAKRIATDRTIGCNYSYQIKKESDYHYILI